MKALPCGSDGKPEKGTQREGMGLVTDMRSRLSELLCAERASLNQQLEQQHRTLVNQIESWLQGSIGEDRQCPPRGPDPAFIMLPHKDISSFDSCPCSEQDVNMIVPAARSSKDLHGTDKHLAPPTTDSLPPLMPADLSDSSDEEQEKSSSHGETTPEGSSYGGDLMESKSSKNSKVLRVFTHAPEDEPKDNKNDTHVETPSRMRRCQSSLSTGSMLSTSSRRSRSKKDNLLRVFTVHSDFDGIYSNKEDDAIRDAASKSQELKDQMLKVASTLSMSRETREFLKLKGMKRMVRSHQFELVMASLITINTAAMAAYLQYKGSENGAILGVAPGSIVRNDVINDVFTVLDTVFGIIFVIELLLKLLGLRCQFWYELWNIFDSIVVLLWLLDTFKIIETDLKPAILRLARLARLLRMIRLIKGVRMFDTLQLLVRSIKASMSTLWWASVVLLILQTFAAMLMYYGAEHYIEDQSKPIATRREVWKYFGTFARALLTMFEVTLGNWLPPCRLMMENVASWYGAVFVVWKMTIGFAVVRVVSAVFIQQTLKVATRDEDIMVGQKAKDARNIQQELKRLFLDLDLTQDGVITIEEFQIALSNDRVRHLLSALEINVVEAVDVFELLDNGNGEVSWDEFVVGMRRIKGPAQSVDLVRLLFDHKRECQVQQDLLEEQLHRLEELHRDICTIAESAKIVKKNRKAPVAQESRQ